MPESAPSNSPLTPMLRQYLEIKEQHKDAILFYRIGDFYEMFFDDAVKASKVLDIVLTSRNKNDPNPVPLCGVPYHSVQRHLDKLIAQGFKVAICDQVEDPPSDSKAAKGVKGVVRREVTRVVTPALTDDQDGTLVSLFRSDKEWGLVLLKIASGDFRVTVLSREGDLLREELARIRPCEVILSEALKGEDLKLDTNACVGFLPEWIWDEAYARRILYKQFGVSTLSGFHCEGIPAGVIAAGAALHYVHETQKVSLLPHVTSLKRYERSETMLLSEESRKNLSLDELIGHLDRTKTAMGHRTLKEWFARPLLQKKSIEDRLDAVEELKARDSLRLKIDGELEKVYDLHRINSRLSLGHANARDLSALAQSLEAIDQMAPLLTELNAVALKALSTHWNSFVPLRREIQRVLVDGPPIALKEGGLIRSGIDDELDELRRIRHDSKGAIAAIEDRERQRTGIGSLKVQFNRVFGYYLEVTSANLSKVPLDYIRKQTLAKAERYVTPEIKDFENKILGAEEKIKTLEYEIFLGLRQKALQAVSGLQEQAERLASLDVFSSLAAYAREIPTVRPRIEESGFLEIRGGRHPIVEKNIPAGGFVPNDLSLDVAGDRLLIITGPNMAGKSTILRQAGIIVLMAQAGSFVPADSVRIGIVDQIFTRVGAADRLARGESTFMVEMCETAAILHYATQKSLILLDEIGRGTSTFDGISIAWAVAEYLHDHVKARTLFATHYHELIDLAAVRPGIKNYNVQVKEEGDGIVFLYRLALGGMSHSYGIHVARLAGLPEEVLERSKEILKNLERKKDDGQASLF